MKKILIVEDHKDTAKLVEQYLRMVFPADWPVVVADSGRKAIDLAVQERPDVMVLDIALTDDIDGMQVIREIAKTEARPRIILVTALGNKAFRGPRPGRPWVDQLQENEKALVSDFFEKTYMSWQEFLTAIAKAAGVPVPEEIKDL